MAIASTEYTPFNSLTASGVITTDTFNTWRKKTNGLIVLLDGTTVGGGLSSSNLSTGAPSWTSLGETSIFGGSAVTSGNALTIVAGTGSTNGLIITQTGTGAALRVNDITSDTTPLIVDENGHLIVGHTATLPVYNKWITSTISPHISTVGTSAALGASMSIYAATINTQAGILAFAKSRGSVATPLAIITGDSLGVIDWQGHDGTNPLSAANIECISSGTVASGNVQGALLFSTRNTAGTLAERMRIDSAGLVGIGKTPTVALDVNGAITSSGTVTGNVLTNGTVTISGSVISGVTGFTASAGGDIVTGGKLKGNTLEVGSTAQLNVTAAGVLSTSGSITSTGGAVTANSFATSGGSGAITCATVSATGAIGGTAITGTSLAISSSGSITTTGNIKGGALYGTQIYLEDPTGSNLNTDALTIQRVNGAADVTQLQISVGDNGDATDKLVVGYTSGTFVPKIELKTNGDITATGAIYGNALNANNAGIFATGAISGATTINASGAITAGGLITAVGIAAGGAISGATNISISGNITGANNSAFTQTGKTWPTGWGGGGGFLGFDIYSDGGTIGSGNGSTLRASMNASGAIIGTSLALSSGGISATGAIGGATTISASSTITAGGMITGVSSGSGLITPTGGLTLGAGGYIYRTGDQDTATSASANVKISSWYGIGFGPSISGQTVPQWENAVWIDCRLGNLNVRADIIAYSTSDRKYKDNITNITNPLDKVAQINGVSFDWNDKQSTFTGRDIGVIAQEVEAVLPEVVTTRDDGSKAVKYDKMVALLIECVKELKAEIEELKSKVN